MIFEIPKEDILKLTIKQVDNLFCATDQDRLLIVNCFNEALERCNRCFELSPNKYYNRGGEVYFNPFHSVQYMTYLYYLANSIHQVEGSNTTCDKLYYLNKSLNAIDLFYAVELPDFFMAEHPVGTVIGGHGKIGSGLLFYQGCTLGGYHEKDGTISYPNLGNNVKLFAHAGVIGRCTIGNNVNIGAGTVIKNQDIPDNVNVFGQSPNLIIKPKK